MLRKIKKVLKKYPMTSRFLAYYYWWLKLYSKLIVKVLLFRFPVNKRFLSHKKPTMLQLQISYKCNLNCIMCGMNNMRDKKDFSPEEFSRLIQNKLFKNIKSVGISGGEPFLMYNLYQYIDELIKYLPKLRNIYIITNGYFTNQTLQMLEKIKQICSTNSVKLTVSFSVDGINETHDFVRGKNGAFINGEKTCFSIVKDKKKYCDEFDTICTITKHNIYNINEVDVWAKKNNIPISYNVATLHKRLCNESKFDNFSVYSNEHVRFLTAEFFYSKFYETKSSKYYALYKYILDMRRRTGCDFKYDGVTVTSEGNIYYCAARSDVVGNGFDDDASNIYFSNINYRNQLIKDECDSCSHYVGSLTFKASLEYNNEILRAIGNPLKYC